jgi:preprotein translocase subunit YajC
MRPAGWILLFILVVLLTYFIIRWLQRRSDKNLDKLG